MTPQDKLFLSVREAAHLLGIGRSKLYELIKTGAFSTAKLGARTLIRRDEITRFAATLGRDGWPTSGAGTALTCSTSSPTAPTRR